MGSINKRLNLQFQGFLATPPLWKDSGPINIPQFLTHPLPVPQEIENDLLVPDNLILGKRVEHFFAYYVEKYTSHTLLAQNVVVTHGKTTIGEVDFLLLNKENNEYTHVELVYKFYLYDPLIKGELNKWIGPNRNDTLKKKLHRLKAHQFPLLHREESRTAVQDYDLPLERIFQKVCFKANLFVPPDLLNYYFPEINNDCIQGFWIRMEDFIERDYGDFGFHSPAKHDWPIDPKYFSEWISFTEIKELLLSLLESKRSPLVWMKKSETEFLRFFFVWW